MYSLPLHFTNNNRGKILTKIVLCNINFFGVIDMLDH